MGSGEFRGTEQIISAKQNQNIKEALTGASSILNIWRENRAIVLKPKQEMAIYSLVQRRDVIEILSTGFGKRMIFIVFAMGKEEMSSSKASMITISPLKSTTDDQISKIFSLSCTAMDLMTETVNLSRESPPQFSLLLGVREYRTPAHYIERCPRLWSMSIILHTWSSLGLSYNSNLKIALYVKIQHPANNT